MELFIGQLENLLIAIVSAILLIFNTSPVNQNGEKVDTSTMTLTFEDNFDGDTLNSNIWRAHNSFGVRKGGFWSGEQVSVKDGNLIITTEYKSDGEYGAGWYTSGISTQDKFEQKYGYFECRCILPKGEGLWSAFWMTNPNVSKESDDASNGAEIDVFESPFYYKGNNNWKVTSNLHYSGYSLKTKYKNVGIWELDNNPYENFNTYGVLWNEDGYTFYVNGYKVATTDYAVSSSPEYLILSCEVDGTKATAQSGWSGNIENNDKNTFKAEFIVDYVRAYSF